MLALQPSPPRRLARVLLPLPVRKAIATRFLGSRWFPVRRRVLDVILPPSPGTGVTPEPLHLEVPPHLLVPRVLQEKGLADYEPYALDAFLALVELAPDGPVLDVGANIGLYGLLAAAYSDREVHAFEPAPEVAAVAREIAAASGLRVTVHESALGREEGVATLFLSDSTDSSNSLDPTFRAHSREVAVRVETVDAFCSRTGLVPSVIKIDTETTEHDVVAGAAKVIREHRPWILAEVLWSLSEDNLHAVIDEFDYTIYHLAGPGPRPVVDRMVGDPTWTHYMFLFAPEPVDDRIWERMNAWRTALQSTEAEHPQRV